MNRPLEVLEASPTGNVELLLHSCAERYAAVRRRHALQPGLRPRLPPCVFQALGCIPGCHPASPRLLPYVPWPQAHVSLDAAPCVPGCPLTCPRREGRCSWSSV